MDTSLTDRVLDTRFAVVWREYARDRGLPSPAESAAVAQQRRDAMHFFSAGLVHQEATRRRLEQLLPTPTPPAKFQQLLPGMPKGFPAKNAR